jgi:hypothetical protein
MSKLECLKNDEARMTKTAPATTRKRHLPIHPVNLVNPVEKAASFQQYSQALRCLPT